MILVSTFPFGDMIDVCLQRDNDAIDKCDQIEYSAHSVHSTSTTKETYIIANDMLLYEYNVIYLPPMS